MLCLHDPLLACQVTEHDFTRNAGGHSVKILLEQKTSRENADV